MRYPPEVYAAAREGFEWTRRGIGDSLHSAYPLAVGALRAMAREGLRGNPARPYLTPQAALAAVLGASAAARVASMLRERARP